MTEVNREGTGELVSYPQYCTPVGIASDAVLQVKLPQGVKRWIALDLKSRYRDFKSRPIIRDPAGICMFTMPPPIRKDWRKSSEGSISGLCSHFYFRDHVRDREYTPIP